MSKARFINPTFHAILCFSMTPILSLFPWNYPCFSKVLEWSRDSSFLNIIFWLSPVFIFFYDLLLLDIHRVPVVFDLGRVLLLLLLYFLLPTTSCWFLMMLWVFVAGICHFCVCVCEWFKNWVNCKNVNKLNN